MAGENLKKLNRIYSKMDLAPEIGRIDKSTGSFICGDGICPGPDSFVGEQEVPKKTYFVLTEGIPEELLPIKQTVGVIFIEARAGFSDRVIYDDNLVPYLIHEKRQNLGHQTRFSVLEKKVHKEGAGSNYIS